MIVLINQANKVAGVYKDESAAEAKEKSAALSWIKEVVRLPDSLTVEVGMDDPRLTMDPDELAELQSENIRAERDSLLTACDWTQLPDSPLSETDKTAWADYRAALRDVPQQAGFPGSVEWPVAP